MLIIDFSWRSHCAAKKIKNKVPRTNKVSEQIPPKMVECFFFFFKRSSVCVGNKSICFKISYTNYFES